MINQQLIGNTPRAVLLHAHFDGLIARTEANVYWKDLRGKYLDANNWQVKRSGAQTHQHLMGVTDQDLVWKESAPILMKNDREIIFNKQATILIEKVNILGSKQANYLSYKSPLLSRKGKIIGIFGLSYLVGNQANNSRIVDELSLIAGKQNTELTRKLLSNSQQSASSLTKRQLACVHLLTKGMTMKQIAKSLSLSPRTVEHYLEAAKIKLNCLSKTELLVKALESSGSSPSFNI